jgi:hypothetical protein
VSATWEQLTGAEPIEGYQAMLGDDYPVARAVILGEDTLLSMDTARRDPEGQIVKYQKNDWLLGIAFTQVKSEWREATQVPGCLAEGAIEEAGSQCNSLEWLTGTALVHHVHDANGEKRAVVIGLVAGEQLLESLPYSDGDGPVVFTIAATVEEPRAMAQLELFAAQYEVYYKAMVAPFIGMPSIIWRKIDHVWMSPQEWTQLDLNNLALDDRTRKPEQEEYPRVFEEFIELAVNAAGPA